MRKESFLLFLLEVGGLSSSLWNYCVYKWALQKGGPFFLFLTSFLGIAILVGMILFAVLTLYTRFMARYTQQDQRDLMHPLLITLTPFLILYLSLLEHFVYLRDIQGVLPLVSVLGIAYLHYSFWERSIKIPSLSADSEQERNAFPHRFSRPKLTSRSVLILSIFLYILYASGVFFPSQPITGDEPHYLLITYSLISDGDINLFNNYRDKDYLRFYPGELESHAHPGKKGHGYEYSNHLPGLPLLLVPSYFIGEKLGSIVPPLARDPTRQQRVLIFTIQAFMGLLAALLGWVFFLFARDFTKNQNAALLSWGVFILTSPLFFYSHLIYPEIPASLLMIAILYNILGVKIQSSSAFLWTGLGIALFPWLGIKYTILSLGLFAITFYIFWKSGRMRGKNLLLFLTPLFVSSGLFLFHLWTLYGNIRPSSLYRGFRPADPGFFLPIFHFDLGEFFRCGLSYLFDQRIGIFPYAPIYLIFIPGIIISVRRKIKNVFPVLGILFLYWGFCSLAYYWGGYCPPGRTLLPVVWIVALFMAEAFTWGKNKGSIIARRGLLFLSFGITFICAKHPEFLYHEELSGSLNPSGVYSKLLTSFSNSIVNFRNVVPSLINKERILWMPMLYWLLALVFVCFLSLKKEDKALPVHSDLKKPVFGVFLLAALFVAYTFFNIHLEHANDFKEKQYTLYFQDDNNFGSELGGFWTRGQRKADILIWTDYCASEIRVKLSSPIPGKAKVRVGKIAQSSTRSRLGYQGKTLVFPSPVGFPWRGGHLYSIGIQEERGFYPYRLDPKVQDNRFLGVFVEIEAEQDKNQNHDPPPVKDISSKITPHMFQLPHSCRRAITGSTRAARIAG